MLMLDVCLQLRLAVENVCLCRVTCVLRGLRKPILSDSWRMACLITGRGADSGQTALHTSLYATGTLYEKSHCVFLIIN